MRKPDILRLLLAGGPFRTKGSPAGHDDAKSEFGVHTKRVAAERVVYVVVVVVGCLPRSVCSLFSLRGKRRPVRPQFSNAGVTL